MASSPMAMKVRAARGVLWSLVEYGGGEGVSFLVFLVLARLVAPADFGMVALAGIFVAFVQVFLAQGFSDAVIQREALDEDHCSTAFWTNVAIALVFLVATLLLAQPIAAFFHEPRLATILRWLSPVFVFTGLNSIHQAVFKRNLQFASFALRALAGITAGGIVGVVMALNGYGVWSLVGQQLANGVVSLLVIWGTSPWRPRLRFSRGAFGDMARFSFHVIAGNLVKFFYLKTDVFLIGLFISTQDLGYYTLVQRLLVTCGLVTQSSVQPIVLPVLARFQNDPARFREGFLTAVRLTQLFWLPLAVGIGVVADPMITLFFGAKWAPAVPLMEIMSLIGFTQLFSYFTAPALVALSRPEIVVRITLAQVGITLVLFVPAALAFGVLGVTAAFTLLYLVIIPIHVVVLRRVAAIDLPAVIWRCRASLVAGAAMAAAVMLLKTALGGSMPAPALLALLILAGAAVYVATLAAFGRREVREIRDLAAAAIGRRPLATS